MWLWKVKQRILSLEKKHTIIQLENISHHDNMYSHCYNDRKNNHCDSSFHLISELILFFMENKIFYGD